MWSRKSITSFSVAGWVERNFMGIAIHHYAFDRALLEAQGRIVRAWHRQQCEVEGNLQLEALRDRLCWVIILSCGLHDIWNGIKHALYAHPSMIPDLVGRGKKVQARSKRERRFGGWTFPKFFLPLPGLSVVALGRRHAGPC